jgi:hypothetical protein
MRARNAFTIAAAAAASGCLALVGADFDRARLRDDAAGDATAESSATDAPSDVGADAGAPTRKDLLFSRRGHGPDMQFATAVGLDAQMNVYVLTTFRGTINFGGPSDATSRGFEDVLFTKLDAKGKHVVTKQLGGLGGGQLLPKGGSDVLVVALDDDGEHVWSRTFGSVEDLETAFTVAVDANDHVFLGGAFAGQVAFGADVRSSQRDRDAFVLQLDARNGAPMWSTSFGGSGLDDVLALACLPTGELVVGGAAIGTVDIGDGPQSSADQDAFVAVYGR